MTKIDFGNILKTVLEDSQFVFSKHTPFVKNYKRKIEKNIFDETLARKGLNHYIPQALETFNSKTNQFITLDKSQKEEFKEIILKKILEDIENYDQK